MFKWIVKIVLFIFLAFPVFYSRAANTDIVITEIGAYEPTDREWIEIYNRGLDPVDITGWKFFEDNINHGLGLTAYRGDFIIDPGEYAIIADVASNFETDHPAFTGTIIDSSWNILKESGEAIALKDSTGAIVESFTYLAAPAGSLLRLNPNIPDYSASNWVEHVGENSAGFPNSTSQSGIINQESGTLSSNNTNQNSSSESSSSNQTAPSAPPAYGAGTVVINEFMPDPGEDSVEWIEIMSKAEAVINLAGWIIEDGLGKIAEISGELFPQGFQVIELSAARLNNSGDSIKLIDSRGALIDQATYGGFDDGNTIDNAPKVKYPNSLARGAGGLDTDRDGKDFFISSLPTPGSANNIGLQAATTEEEILSEEEEKADLPSVLAPSQENPPVFSSSKNSVPVGEKKKESRAAAFLSAGAIYVRGTVTVPPGILGSQVFYIQTANGGYEIYMFKKDFPELEIGDEVGVSGARSEAINGRRVKVRAKDDITILDKGSTVEAAEVSANDLSDDLIASLVKISGEVLEIQSGGKFMLADDEGEVLIYIKSSAGIGEINLAEGDKVTVTGILSQIKSGWRVLPRFGEDIEGSRAGVGVQEVRAKEPLSLNKSSAVKIILAGLGLSGVGAGILGIKFREKIFSRKRKQEVMEEEIELDKYEI